MAPSTKGRDRKGERAAGSSTPRKTTRKPAVKPLSATAQGAELDEDALEFIAALDRFKKEHNRPFPTWSEVLHVLRQLGYRKA